MLHHHRPNRRRHVTPCEVRGRGIPPRFPLSAEVHRQDGPESDVTRVWTAVQAATVALCVACHGHLEAFQGKTRARGLPFPLALRPGGFNKRAGRCTCPTCAAT